MNVLTKTAVAAMCSAVLVVPLSIAGTADAATHFANCTAMRRTYKHGVAKSSTAAAHQVRMGYGRPVVAPKVYVANISSDRDKDGTACEA